MSCAPHGSVLGPVLCNVFVSTVDERIESILSKFGDDAELGAVADMLEGCAAI